MTSLTASHSPIFYRILCHTEPHFYPTLQPMLLAVQQSACNKKATGEIFAGITQKAFSLFVYYIRKALIKQGLTSCELSIKTLLLVIRHNIYTLKNIRQTPTFLRILNHIVMPRNTNWMPFLGLNESSKKLLPFILDTSNQDYFHSQKKRPTSVSIRTKNVFFHTKNSI